MSVRIRFADAEKDASRILLFFERPLIYLKNFVMGSDPNVVNPTST